MFLAKSRRTGNFTPSPNFHCLLQIQVGFYRGVVAPLFEEWHRLMNSRLSTVMLHHFISNQARWDLMVQQETRGGVMMESAASTTSSSNGGSSESRRESFDPANSLSAPGFRDGPGPSGFRGDRPHRFSRSSAEGDDDSDPCSSYPYLPLDQCRGDLAQPPAAAKPGMQVDRWNSRALLRNLRAIRCNIPDFSSQGEEMLSCVLFRPRYCIAENTQPSPTFTGLVSGCSLLLYRITTLIDGTGTFSAMLIGDVAGFTRRHSLPLSEIRSARQAMQAASRTSSEESADAPSPLQHRPSTSSSLHRQYSLVERRR